MTITGNLRVKQPFVGIEVAPNNDFLFWGEKENLQGDSSAKSDKNTSIISLKKKRGVYLFSDRHLKFST